MVIKLDMLQCRLQRSIVVVLPRDGRNFCSSASMISVQSWLQIGRTEHLWLEIRAFFFRTPVSEVADIIKMEFTASKAYVAEIRLAGLVVL